MINWQQVTWQQYAYYQQLLLQWQTAVKDGDEEQQNIIERAILTCWLGTELPDDADLAAGLFLAIVSTPLPEIKPLTSTVFQNRRYQLPEDMKAGDQLLIMGSISFGDALEALQTDELMHQSSDSIQLVLQAMFNPDKVLDISAWPVSVVLGLYQTFQEFRQQLVETYPVLFRSAGDGKTQRAGINKLNRFGWYNLLYEAAGGQLQHFDTIKDKNLHTVMQFLVRKREEQQFVNRLQQVYAEEAINRNRRP